MSAGLRSCRTDAPLGRGAEAENAGKRCGPIAYPDVLAGRSARLRLRGLGLVYFPDRLKPP